MPLQALLVGPLIDRPAHKLGSVVAADLARQPTSSLQFFQHAHHPYSSQRSVHLDLQALPGVVIHDVQGAKPPSRAECIAHEVHRPYLIGSHGLRQRLAHRAALSSTLAPQRQLLLHIQPVHPLVIHLPAFALQQNLQTAVAEPAPGLRQLAQPHPQWLVLAPAFPIATRRTIQLHQPTGPSLAQRHFHLHHQHCLSPRLRAHHFFATTAFNARMSTACSATMCLSCRFSSSSCFSRLASLNSNPPYLLFHRSKHAFAIPCRRHSSPVSTPPSDSFRMAMI